MLENKRIINEENYNNYRNNWYRESLMDSERRVDNVKKEIIYFEKCPFIAQEMIITDESKHMRNNQTNSKYIINSSNSLHHSILRVYIIHISYVIYLSLYHNHLIYKSFFIQMKKIIKGFKRLCYEQIKLINKISSTIKLDQDIFRYIFLYYT